MIEQRFDPVRNVSFAGLNPDGNNESFFNRKPIVFGTLYRLWLKTNCVNELRAIYDQYRR